MSRGTEVGRGYVALEINGDGMNEDIVDEIDRAGPGIERVGGEHGEKYGDAFEGGFFARIRARFSQGIAEELHRRAAADGRSTGDQLGSGIISGLRAQLAQANDLFDGFLDDLGGDGEKTTRQMSNLTNGMRVARLASAQLEASLRRTLLEGASTVRSDGIDELRRRLGEAQDSMSRYMEDLGNYSGTSVKKLAMLRSGVNASRLAAAELEKQLIRTIAAEEKSQGVSGNGRDKDRLGTNIGVMFGAGSRNNFLNTFGKSLGGIVNLLDGARKAGSVMFSAFKTGFDNVSQGASFAQKALGGFSQMGVAAGATGGKVFAGLVASAPAAVAAILAVVVGLSVLVTILSALIGIVAALAATITSALVGSLLVLGGAVGALVAAGGLLTAAFMSMTEAQKTLIKDAFQPLKAEMTGIGQIIMEDLVPAFATWSANLQQALMLAVPVAEVMGSAFAEAGNSLTAAFAGPGFQAFALALGTYLPNIVTRMSLALGSFLNGTTAMFAAIMPYVSQFADYLARVAEEFSVWANSAGGQNAIVDFTDRALESLRSLWDFLGQLGGLLADVLFSPSGQTAGNNMFDGLTDAVARFRDYISDGGLEKWFADAEKFASALGSTMEGLGRIFDALNSSGVLGLVVGSLEGLAWIMNLLDKISGPISQAFEMALGGAMIAILGPIGLVVAGLKNLVKVSNWALDQLNKIPGVSIGEGGGGGDAFAGSRKTLQDAIGQKNVAGSDRAMARRASTSLESSSPNTQQRVIDRGNTALNQTYKSDGGYVPDPVKPKIEVAKYINPYKEWARSLIEQSPTIKVQIRKALWALNRAFSEGLGEATKATDAASVISTMKGMADKIKDSGQDIVDNARSALNSAANTLAGATSKKDAAAALKNVKAAQKDMKAAIQNQKNLDKAAAIVEAQSLVRGSVVSNLVNGFAQTTATLAEYAEARGKVAEMIESANRALADAISMRDTFNKQVADGVRSFGGLMTAQAQTLNGVAQALTAKDVTDNLQDRLTRIQKFNADLRVLLSQGLSNAAYKQLLEGGVENGAAYVEAMVAGGSGAINTVNGLVSEIDKAANALGSESSSRLYQAGVDAAQGLVDGLNSLSGQLDSAAARLGDSIAASLKRSLGIASPSKVIYDMMDHVGDGAEGGLDNQHRKVGAASDRLAAMIAPSPEVARYAASQGQSPYVSGVSGNNDDPRFRDLIVQTPTENPEAVAMEVLNEVVGRL